jgi:hypothetical protein
VWQANAQNGTYARAGLRKQLPLGASSAFAIEPYYRSRKVSLGIGRDGYTRLEVLLPDSDIGSEGLSSPRAAAVVAQKVAQNLGRAPDGVDLCLETPSSYHSKLAHFTEAVTLVWLPPTVMTWMPRSDR